MLHGISGSEERLSACPDSPSFSTISLTRCQPGEFDMVSPVQSSAIWTVILPQNLHKSDGRSAGATETKGNIYCTLPRRPVTFADSKSQVFSNLQVTQTRLGSLGRPLKLEKSNLSPAQEMRFLGVQKLSAPEHFHPTGEGRKNSVCGETDPIQPLSDIADSSGSLRTAHRILPYSGPGYIPNHSRWISFRNGHTRSL